VVRLDAPHLWFGKDGLVYRRIACGALCLDIGGILLLFAPLFCRREVAAWGKGLLGGVGFFASLV
jgi:hypothetical protein